jgi:hypothetical protein
LLSLELTVLPLAIACRFGEWHGELQKPHRGSLDAFLSGFLVNGYGPTKGVVQTRYFLVTRSAMVSDFRCGFWGIQLNHGTDSSCDVFSEVGAMLDVCDDELCELSGDGSCFYGQVWEVFSANKWSEGLVRQLEGDVRVLG